MTLGQPVVVSVVGRWFTPLVGLMAGGAGGVMVGVVLPAAKQPVERLP
jgi:hypothetical protein